MTRRCIVHSGILAALTAAALGCADSKSSRPSLTDPSLGGGTPAADSSCMGLPTAPQSQRVDLARPSFSNPTNVTNPLFPISSQFRVVMLGKADGLPFRAEVTLLSDTRTVDLDGNPVETLVSQYVAFLDGRLFEVALDFYGQDDGGAAWYFGEDVFNYEDGLVADTEGTWLAGRDGPVAMIMPADPQVGNVYRPENICGLVFEEVTVQSTGLTVDGPTGPVSGAITVQELHMDGTFEDKTFAPGYGEFTTGAGGDLEAVALAVPTDALPGLPPKELETLYTGAADLFDAAQSGQWDTALTTYDEMNAAWEDFKSGEVPPRLEAQMDEALEELTGTLQAEAAEETRQATINVARASLDLQLQYRTAAETDLDLLDLWARQLVVDAAAGDQGGVLGDAATLKWIRDRVARDVTLKELQAIDARLEGLRAAAAAGDLTRAAGTAVSLRATVSQTRAKPYQRRQ
ncbi:MAG: hypothetical protein H0V43_12030 [Gemmatimonadales bacterium]|nr:hypothetical protein [Gemmatimonadales bacterium]MBA3555163.1 hypothetical protein [Gemmatimonadales bacterium]